MKHIVTLAVLGAVLSACGGSSDNDNGSTTTNPPVVVTPPVTTPTTPTTPTPDAVTSASQAVATAAGLTVIAGANANETVYDVAADIGDTWRITFNSTTKAFTVKVLSTQFGLVDRSGTFTSVTDGNITTYTATDLQVSVDARTRLLTGSIKMGSLASTVSGTGYAVSDIAKLAGTYAFVGAIRNAVGGGDRFVPKGAMKVGADGAAQLCIGGAFNAQGTCAPVNGLGEADNASLTLVKDTATGLIKARNGQQDFGIVHVHAGDRGVALIIDRFGRNDSNTVRVGTMIAAKQQKIGTEINGTYACADTGGATGKIEISGTGATVTNNATGRSHAETVTLNKAGASAQSADFDGLAVLKDPEDGPADYSMFLPVSSSVAYQVVTDKPYLTICTKK